MAIQHGMLAGMVAGGPSPEYVRRAAAAGFGVRVEDLCGGRRQRELVVARHVAMAAVRFVTGASYPAIGRLFGQRDHTTAMHAVAKVARGQHEERHRRLWEACDRLCAEVRDQWAIDNGRPRQATGQLVLHDTPPTQVVFS
jgi:hypothetical protein